MATVKVAVSQVITSVPTDAEIQFMVIYYLIWCVQELQEVIVSSSSGGSTIGDNGTTGGVSPTSSSTSGIIIIITFVIILLYLPYCLMQVHNRV